jgi:hypothetical protein
MAAWRSGLSGWPWAESSLFIASKRDGGMVTPFTTRRGAVELAGAAFLGAAALSCAAAVTAKVPATRAAARFARLRCMEFPLL